MYHVLWGLDEAEKIIKFRNSVGNPLAMELYLCAKDVYIYTFCMVGRTNILMVDVYDMFNFHGDEDWY